MSLYAVLDERDGTFLTVEGGRTDDLDHAALFHEAVIARQWSIDWLANDGRVVEVVECEACGKMRLLAEIQAVQTAQATWSSPAEYADVCRDCLDKQQEREEAARDRYWDRKIAEAMGK